jgi:hypothetical protein
LEIPSQINGDYLQNLRYASRRTFRNTKWKYIKDEIIKHETNNKKKKYYSCAWKNK